jgi:hypothetical protein
MQITPAPWLRCSYMLATCAWSRSTSSGASDSVTVRTPPGIAPLGRTPQSRLGGSRVRGSLDDSAGAHRACLSRVVRVDWAAPTAATARVGWRLRSGGLSIDASVSASGLLPEMDVDERLTAPGWGAVLVEPRGDQFKVRPDEA